MAARLNFARSEARKSEFCPKINYGILLRYLQNRIRFKRRQVRVLAVTGRRLEEHSGMLRMQVRISDTGQGS